MSYQHLRRWLCAPRAALSLGAGAAALALAAAPAAARPPTQSIHQTSADSPPGSLDVSVALSDGDLLAFRAAGPGGVGIFALQPSHAPASGGVLLTIRGENFGTQAMSPPSLNPAGDIAFSDLDNGASALFSFRRGGTLLTIHGDNFGSFRSPTMGADGTLFCNAFDSTGGSALLAAPPGGSIITLMGSNFGVHPDGRVVQGTDRTVYTRGADENGPGIFARAHGGGNIITIVGSQFDTISSPAVSGQTVVFTGHHHASGVQGLFAAPPGGGIITIYGDNFLHPSIFTDPEANEAGAIVFGRFGAADGGIDRIFYTDLFGGDTQTLVALGDELLGSTVTRLTFSPEGLNEAGEFAFWAELADGASHIFVATGIPAPGAAALLAVGGAALLRRRRPAA